MLPISRRNLRLLIVGLYGHQSNLERCLFFDCKYDVKDLKQSLEISFVPFSVSELIKLVRQVSLFKRVLTNMNL